ncbi:MAG: nitrate reductase molybdenum cofactor assembly chaperone [Solirubrobacteraceae bacterium]
MRRRARRSAVRAQLFKLCSLLLCYPDEQLLAERQALAQAAADLPDPLARRTLVEFCEWWAAQDALALQQHYVQTLDLHKRCGLYLSYYEQGDRRARGAGLLRLKRMYRAAGLPLAGSELPDYLPAMLEFAAAAPEGWGVLMLEEHRPALALLAEALRECETPYAAVVDAVRAELGAPSGAERARAVAMAAAGPPTELVGLEVTQ